MKDEVKDAVTDTTTATAAATALSKDGTVIAYEKNGQGPSLIVVGGALSHRNAYTRELSAKLASHFTVISYDRRGRGESKDTKPYAVDREIEDIEALIDKAGGSVYLYGTSSGAALALLTAEKLGPTKITKLALYEPPYGSASKEAVASEKRAVNKFLSDDEPAEAVTFFLEKRGIPSDKMEAMKQSPEWKDMVSMAPTLMYDLAILGDGTVPFDVAKRIAIPTLVMDGEKSFPFMHATADTVGKTIPGAQRKTIKGQTHNLSADAGGPVLLEFFK